MSHIGQGKRKGWRMGAAVLALGLAFGMTAMRPGEVGAALEPLPAPLSQQLALDAPQARAQLPDGRWLVLARDGRFLELRSGDDSAKASRRWSLPAVRRLASVSLLPSGRALVWGGVDEQGRAQPQGLWFDFGTQTLAPTVSLALVPRAGHAATVLSDGRLLLTGGWSPGVAGVTKSELWDERDGKVQVAQGAWSPPRLGHASALGADGRVRLSGGVDAKGRRLLKEDQFDPERQMFVAAAKQAASTGSTVPALSGSWPAPKSADVSPEARLWLRFNEPLRVSEVNASSVVLFGPGGRTAVRVVPVEGGRLVFVTPQQALFPGSAYTLLIDGVRARNGQPLAATAIDFRTIALNADEVAATEPTEVQVTGEGAARVCTQKGAWYAPCRARSELKDGVWYPGADNTDSRWRIYTPDQRPTPNASMAKTAALYGVTAVRGRVVRVDEQPVANVEVSIGSQKARTNADGWFTLLDAPAGWQELYVDGSTANGAEAEYGQFVVGVRVAKAQLTELSYLLHLPRITARDKIRISSPLKQELRVGHPDIPGLELRIPADTVIRDRKGRLVTELAIVPTPVNRAPFPVKENHPMAFTLEPGGAQVQGLTPAASGGIRVFYPNYDRKPAGTVADFWIYDPREGWRVYGQGTVSEDGKQFEPERGVALHQTMGGMYSVPNNDPPPKDGMPPDGGECGSKGCDGSASDGDPVDLHTGDFTYRDTDLTIADVVPLTISRHYRPRDMMRREFGIGTSLGYNYYLQRSSDDYLAVRLVLPNGSAVQFDRVAGTGAQGEWRQNGSRTAFAGAVMRTVYDADPEQPYGRAYQVALRDGSIMQFGSYNNTKLQWVQDRFGNQTRLGYTAGLLTQLVSPNGRLVTFVYDTQNRISTASDHTGRKWAYEYDDRGLLKKVTYPDQTTKRYTYLVGTFADDFDVCPAGINVDPRFCLYAKQHKQFGTTLLQHVMESVTDRRGNRIVYNEYPKHGSWIGRIARQTLADNSTYTFNYSNTPEGNFAVLVTRPDGLKRRVIFDESAAPYPISDTYGYGTSQSQTYLFERYASGQVKVRTDPLGRKTEYAYNSEGQVALITEMAGTPLAQTTRMAYEDGKPSRVTDPLNRIAKLEYTDGCLTRIVNPMGQTTDMRCDAKGQVSAVTNALGDTTHYRYESGALVAVVNSMGRVTAFAYDSLGRLVVTRDSAGNIVKRFYDTNDRVRKIVDPMQQETELSYDENGNVEAVLLPHGNGVTYVYDELNRLRERRDGLDKVEKWLYHSSDRIKSHTDRKGQVTSVDYDALGRPQVTHLPDGSTQTTMYDEVDRVRGLIDSLAGSITWEYDDFDQLLKEASDAGVVTYNYDEVGRRIGMTAGTQMKVEYRYNDADQLRRIVQGNEVVEFDYDEIGRRKTMILPNGVTTAYVFNEASELTGLAYAKADGEVLGTLGYGYGPSGKRTAQTGSWANDLMPAASTDNAFDDNHRQVQYQGQNLSYDDNGNLSSDGTRSYVWNARDQLIAIQQSGQIVASFVYDALGRRVAKTEDAQTVRYMYDGMNAVQETRGAISAGILSGLSVDERFARTDGVGRTYFLADALGSTKSLTNEAGLVVQRYNYTPFGQVRASQSGFDNPYQFTGRELDGSGLYYYRARYYHPGMARFISEDPIGLVAGVNTYAYVGGDPISLVDPTGLWAWGDPLNQDLVDAASGFGDGFSVFGWSPSRHIRGAWGIDGGINPCSAVYQTGHLVGGLVQDAAVPAGRIGYIGETVKLGRTAARLEVSESAARRMVAARNALKDKYRGPGFDRLFRGWHQPSYEKLAARKSDAEILKGIGNPNWGFNSAFAGGGIAKFGYGATAEGGCGCD